MPNNAQEQTLTPSDLAQEADLVYATAKLYRDPEPVTVTLPKLQAFAVIAHLQLAAWCYTELHETEPVDLAKVREFADQLTEAIAGDDPRILGIIEDGWQDGSTQSCRLCGCTDHNACVDPTTGARCHWAEENLCSFCSGRHAAGALRGGL